MSETERYLTPVFRMRWPKVFKAEPYKDNEPKFSACPIWTPAKFTKKDKALWQAILKALDDESKMAFKKAWKNLPPNVKRGLRDGTEKEEIDGFGKGTVFANITSKYKPSVMDREKNYISPELGNEDEIYSGCYCRATVTVYSYNKGGGKGVGLGLCNIQKVADGPVLEDKMDATEDFDDDLDEYDDLYGGSSDADSDDVDDDLGF